MFWLQHKLPWLSYFKRSPPAPQILRTESVLQEFVCPVTKEIMKDPVISEDGYSYERSAIQQWLSSKQTSPMTNLRLLSKNLVPNRALRQAIASFQERLWPQSKGMGDYVRRSQYNIMKEVADTNLNRKIIQNTNLQTINVRLQMQAGNLRTRVSGSTRKIQFLNNKLDRIDAERIRLAKRQGSFQKQVNELEKSLLTAEKTISTLQKQELKFSRLRKVNSKNTIKKDMDAIQNQQNSGVKKHKNIKKPNHKRNVRNGKHSKKKEEIFEEMKLRPRSRK